MSGITLLVDDPKWRSHRGLTARLTKAAQAAARSARLKGAFTILLAGDRKLRALNHDFRGKDKPTNVLSFPGADGYAGDIALAYGVTAKEAKAAAKTFADHATHLVVHGVLHLAGYDHETPAQASKMFPIQAVALRKLN